MSTSLADRVADAVAASFGRRAPGVVERGAPVRLGPGESALAAIRLPAVGCTLQLAGGGVCVLAVGLAAARRLAALEDGELDTAALAEPVYRALAEAAAAAAGALPAPAGDPPAPRVFATEDELWPADAQRPHVAVPLSIAGEAACVALAAPEEPTAGRLRLSVELGSARLPREEAMSLTGAVVELDAGVDDPVALLVDGRPFALGRLLVSDSGDWAVAVEALAASPGGVSS